MLIYLYKKRFIIIAIVLLFVMLGGALRYVISVNKQTMVLSLNYSGIDKGLNPDGSRFNVFEVKSNEVLDSAIKKSKLQGYTVDYLRNRIDIFPKLSFKSTENVKSQSEEGTNYSYIPNEYNISYSQKSKLTKNYTNRMLKALAEAYKEYFIKQYTEKNTVLRIDKMNVSNYEYLEIADLYSNKISSMINYLSTHSKENGSYRSANTNQTFGNLVLMLSNLKGIDIQKYRTYVIESALVKNKASYLDKLTYSVNSLEQDYQKAIQSSNFTSSVVSKYDPSITGIMFIPSIDSHNQFYMNRTQIGLDYLTEDAYKEAKQAETIKANIDQYQYLISAFSQASATPDAASEQVANQMLQSIQSKLENISKTALKTDDEYLDYKTHDYLKFEMPNTSLSSFINIKNIVTYGLFGLIFAIILIAIQYFLIKFKKYYQSKWSVKRLWK